MLLESEFALAKRMVGLLISASFLLCVPLRVAFDYLQAHFSKAFCLRLLMVLSIFGSVLLREDVGRVLSGNVAALRVLVLIAADCVLFPSVYLSGAIVEGVGFGLASPEGTLFSTNNYTLALLLVTSGLGRTLGPPCARQLASSGGQTAYAWQQLAITLFAYLLMEWKVMAAHSSQSSDMSSGHDRLIEVEMRQKSNRHSSLAGRD